MEPGYLVAFCVGVVVGIVVGLYWMADHDATEPPPEKPPSRNEFVQAVEVALAKPAKVYLREWVKATDSDVFVPIEIDVQILYAFIRTQWPTPSREKWTGQGFSNEAYGRAATFFVYCTGFPLAPKARGYRWHDGVTPKLLYAHISSMIETQSSQAKRNNGFR